MNVQSKGQQQKTPDIHLTGETVEQIMQYLGNIIVYARSQDGSLRPFVDPTPVVNILTGALLQAETKANLHAVQS
jgi:hypothetical protein